MKCAVVLGADRYDLLSILDPDEPRLEFVEIARATGADILSYESAAVTRGKLFRAIFSRWKKVGSAWNVALLAGKYDRLYITADGVGLPLALMLRARRWKGKIVCVFHNVAWASKKRFISNMLNQDMFSAFVTVNDVQARILIDECGVPRDKVLSVFNWVDEKFFCPADPTSTVAERFIMACGAENRDYNTLSRAARRVTDRFKVYGHGFLSSNVGSDDAPSNLSYMPRVSYKALRDAYSAAEIVVVPLNDVDYAAGVTGLVEAMAAGRPIVATASRGVKDYVAVLDRELVVPAGDDAAMARAIERLKQDPRERNRIGARNRRFAEQYCSLDRYVTRIAKIMMEN